MERFPRLPVLGMLVGVCLLGSHSLPWTKASPVEKMSSTTEGEPSLEGNPSAILTAFCGGCHSNGRARLDLDGPLDLDSMRRDRRTWENVLHKLRTHEMPPRGRRQPSPEERNRVIHWIERGMFQESSEPAQRGRILVRRLQRTEYLNTIRDLFGLRLHLAADFPTDDIGWGRYSEVPPLPPLLLEKYLAAAGSILNEAIVANLPTPETKSQRARTILVNSARRAYRRPLNPGEADALVTVFDRADRNGMAFTEGIKAALTVVLTSPHFLYRIEMQHDPDDPKNAHLGDQFALASRLSYFLWSSMPDDELFALAERGVLRQNLERQVKRMLKNAKSQAMVENFASQWLELRKLQGTRSVDEALQRAMRKETELFVEHVIHEDRSVLEFLDADYTFLNERLAQHYGISGVRGEAMQRVSLPGTQRGGLITQASILTVTSYDKQTSPVKRGKWVLENLLGTPPLAPPSGLVKALDNARRAFEPGTVRQLLEKHRADPSCAHCHAKMDAIGFALENFDATGGWRAADHHQPIDSFVTMPDGESFQGPVQLKGYLRGNQELFIRCLSEKLLTYALGRRLEDRDRAAIDRVPETVAKDQHRRFSSVVIEVVKSISFQTGWSRGDFTR